MKRAAEKIRAGTRVLHDDLYPIKVDNVKRTAVLDKSDAIRVGAAEAFGEENKTTVAKIAWLSKKDVPKANGSMVVYLTKKSDARRLIAEGFFHAGGERDRHDERIRTLTTTRAMLQLPRDRPQGLSMQERAEVREMRQRYPPSQELQ
jgi:hypothetical protein